MIAGSSSDAREAWAVERVEGVSSKCCDNIFLSAFAQVVCLNLGCN